MKRALLATKRTLLELSESMRVSTPLRRLLDAKDPLVEQEGPAHERTAGARMLVRETLATAGFDVEEPARSRRVPDGRFDLAVVVGGDGTVLDIARFLVNTPLVAVNPSPATSTGNFCATTAEGFPALLATIVDKTLSPMELTRLRVSVDGRPYPQPALNDALLANVIPSATSRYILTVGTESEQQKSSGVWISTAAGSTGAIFSAGGRRRPMTESSLQYLVREPCAGRRDDYALRGGMLGVDGISFVSRMIRGGVWLDGRRSAIRVDFGGVVRITPDAPPLRLFMPSHDRD